MPCAAILRLLLEHVEEVNHKGVAKCDTFQILL